MSYNARYPGLGFAILGVPLTLPTIAGAAKNLIGGGSTLSPEERARFDDWFNRAMAGDERYAALLACASGDQAAISAVKAAGFWGPHDTVCGYAGSQTRAYAAQKLLEYKARVEAGSVGTALIRTGTSLVGQSNLPSRIQAVASNPLVLGGVVFVVGLLVFRRRR